MILSLSRASRPTDNGRQERWYRTVKNEKRPHQSLWNFTPAYVHKILRLPARFSDILCKITVTEI